MPAASRYVIDLAIPAVEFERFYRGSANTIVARDRVSGRTVRFPASRMRDFVSPSGVYGRFELLVDEAGRLRSIRKREASGE